MPWHFSLTERQREEYGFPESRYLWQRLYNADTFAESTTHDSDVTSLYGLPALSLKLNTLLEASSVLRKEYLYFTSLFLMPIQSQSRHAAL